MFQVKGHFENDEGSRNLQKWVHTDHNKSTCHYYAKTRWFAMNEQCKLIPQFVSCITKGMKAKIISAMNFMYFIVLDCLNVSCYTSMCNFVKTSTLKICMVQMIMLLMKMPYRRRNLKPLFFNILNQNK